MRRHARVLAAAVVGLATVLLPAPAQAAPGPSGAPQYWFDTWRVHDLWNDGARGQGVTIAEIDTGVNAGLGELSGRVVPGTDLGLSGDGRTDRDLNTFGHGTAMASIMVARPGTLGITGLAPDAKILPVAVPLNGTADQGKPDNLAEAIRYSADHGAKIISMSLGGKRTRSADLESCPADDQAAVFYAMRKGSVVIASVGNTGPTTNSVEEPGVCLGVVSVGSVDQAGTVADFSARQPYLTLVAPGVNIPSLGRLPGAAYSGDGTSQSTALVSAAVALVWSRYPRLTGRQIVGRVLATLDRPRDPHSLGYGYGTLDAYTAVTADVPANAPNPVYAAADPFLQRDAAFARGPSRPPPRPAADPTVGYGSYSVGSAPRVTSQVQRGIVVALVGLIALLGLAAAGLRGRRQREDALLAGSGAAVAPARWDVETSLATQVAAVPEPVLAVSEPARAPCRPMPFPSTTSSVSEALSPVRIARPRPAPATRVRPLPHRAPPNQPAGV